MTMTTTTMTDSGVHLHELTTETKEGRNYVEASLRAPPCRPATAASFLDDAQAKARQSTAPCENLVVTITTAGSLDVAGHFRHPRRGVVACDQTPNGRLVR